MHPASNDFYINEIILRDTQFLSPRYNHTHSFEKLLRGEKAAIEAYAQVIDQFRGNHPRIIELLNSISYDHEDTVFKLTQLLRNEGVEPTNESSAWNSIVHGFVASATLFGNSGAIRALRKGEEMGLAQYETALELSENSAIRNYIWLCSIPIQERHINRLSTLLYLQSVNHDLL